METNNLFRIAAEGYDRAQVDEYIKLLRSEYKKVYDYAKAVETNNEKLKKLCKGISDENAALKANAAPVASVSADQAALIMSVEKLSRLCDEMKLENNALRDKITNHAG